MAQSMTHLASLSVPLCADSIASLPSTKPQKQSFLVGTYELSTTAPRSRVGALVSIEACNQSCTSPSLSITNIDRDVPAVLDVERSGNRIFAACAEGTLLTWKVSDGVVTDKRAICNEKDGKMMYTNVSSGDGKVAGGRSDGGVEVWEIGEGGWNKSARWQGGGMETWSVCLGEKDVWWGGDDGMVRCGRNGEEVWKKRNMHAGVGVTKVVVYEEENEMWSGGYDDWVRVWDLRMMKKELGGVDVGGGVWRIARHSKKKDLRVVAAMYNGVKVVKWRQELQVVGEYNGHDSIAYGASWGEGVEREDEVIGVTGSFYDKSVRMWRM